MGDICRILIKVAVIEVAVVIVAVIKATVIKMAVFKIRQAVINVAVCKIKNFKNEKHTTKNVTGFKKKLLKLRLLVLLT